MNTSISLRTPNSGRETPGSIEKQVARRNELLFASLNVIDLRSIAVCFFAHVMACSVVEVVTEFRGVDHCRGRVIDFPTHSKERLNNTLDVSHLVAAASNRQIAISKPKKRNAIRPRPAQIPSYV